MQGGTLERMRFRQFRRSIAARINVQSAHLRLFRAHVGGRADELMELCVNRRVGQSALRRFGDAEVDHLRHRHTIVQRHQNVRRLDVPAGYWWPGEKKKWDYNSPNRPKEACSSFIAIGSATAGGDVVLGHNTIRKG